MCRSAIEYPPNGKRCGLGAHMTEAEREERRLRRNAREKELYYIRKQRAVGEAVPVVAPPVMLTPETFQQIIENTVGDAEKVAARREVSAKYSEQHASLVSLSQDETFLGGGEDYFYDENVSTYESRDIAARLLSEPQDDLAYQKIVSVDGNFNVNSVNDVKRVFLEDGNVGYFKSYGSAVTDYGTHADYGHDVLESFNNEVVAYRLCTIMGEGYSKLVPKTVFREYNGNLGTLQIEAEGEVGVHSRVRGDRRDECSPSYLRKAALFEYLAGSQDRHGGNYAVINKGHEGDDEVTLIDNGFSFPNREGTTYNQLRVSKMSLSQHDGVIELDESERQMIQNVKKSVEEGELSLLLSAGQRDFMLRRIDGLLEDGSLSEDNCTRYMVW